MEIKDLITAFVPYDWEFLSDIKELQQIQISPFNFDISGSEHSSQSNLHNAADSQTGVSRFQIIYLYLLILSNPECKDHLY